MRERLEAADVVPLGTSASAKIQGFVARERARWAPVVQAAGIKPT